MPDKKKHILIVGGGISGLSAAWYISKISPDFAITILEKNNRIGGWIETIDAMGFQFEKGPRIFKPSKSRELLTFLDLLDLTSQIQYAQGSNDRYLCLDDLLQKLPTGPLSFLTSKITRDLVFRIFQELAIDPYPTHDESIAEFITRRFGTQVLDRMFDPLVQGIYAVDPGRLSIKSCFPTLKRFEDQYGSVLRGLFKEIKKNKEEKALFSIKGGVDQIIKKIAQDFTGSILCNEEVTDLTFDTTAVHLKTKTNFYSADYVFLALPPRQSAKLIKRHNIQGASYLNEIKSVGITSALIGYSESVLPYDGFGYLVSSKQKSPILGAVFDSNPFKTTDDDRQTRMTIMIRGSGFKELEKNKLVHQVLSSHLKISRRPDLVQFIEAQDALPVMEVGHDDKIQFLKANIRKYLPRCYLLGNYLGGVSVNDCIRHSQQTVLEWAMH